MEHEFGTQGLVASWRKSLRWSEKRPESIASVIGLTAMFADFVLLGAQPAGLRLITRGYWLNLALINLALCALAILAASFIGYARAWRARQGG